MITASIGNDRSVNLVGQQGTSWDLVVEVFRDDDNNVPMGLAGFGVRGQFRRNYSSTSPVLIEFTCAVLPADPADNPDANKITISVPPATSSACAIRQGVYDIEIYNEATGYVEKILGGMLTIAPEVTK